MTGKGPILQIPAVDRRVTCSGEGETPVGRESHRGDASALFDEGSPILESVGGREGKERDGARRSHAEETKRLGEIGGKRGLASSRGGRV